MLGAGGFLGAAWALGALSALQEVTDWDVTTADLMVGTSAGAVLAMLLRSGLTVDDLNRDQLCASVGPGGPAAAALDATSGTAAPRAAVTTRLPDFDLEPSGPTFPGRAWAHGRWWSMRCATPPRSVRRPCVRGAGPARPSAAA